MKRILLASVAALGLAGTASAADLAVRAPVPVPLFSWTGCYLGINGGWIGSNNDYSTSRRVLYPFGDPARSLPTAPVYHVSNSYSSNQSGGTLGGQFGCQYQGGWFVLGGEWDANWSSLKDDNYFTLLAPRWPRLYLGSRDRIDPYAARLVHDRAGARGRRLVGSRPALCNGRHGDGRGRLLHASRFQHTVRANPFFIPQYFGAYRENRIGWTVGGGIEWAFAANWTAKAEFLYLDLGSFDYISPRVTFGGHRRRRLEYQRRSRKNTWRGSASTICSTSGLRLMPRLWRVTEQSLLRGTSNPGFRPGVFS